MFPRGAPGAALLLVRAAAAIALLSGPPRVFSLPLEIAIGLGLSGFAIVLGFFTPVAAIVAAVAAAVDLIVHGAAIASLVRLLDAVALALLGPGAYSVDAWLFGRRVIVSSDPLPARRNCP